MLILLPRKRRVALKPFHDEGMHGSMRRPSYSGRRPRMCWVAVKYDQAAEPLSQGTRDAPKRGLYLLWVNWQ